MNGYELAIYAVSGAWSATGMAVLGLWASLSVREGLRAGRRAWALNAS